MKDKVVVITGASSGIGKSLAQKCASEGARVVLAARSAAVLAELEKEMIRQGMDVFAVITDVASRDDCKQLVEKTIEKYGRIDVLINNAGISMRALFRDTDISVLKKVMDVNFWGAVYCSKYALPFLIVSGGSLVGISSIAGYKGLPGRTGYSASKFALQGFLESVRIENRKTGLHVLTACPGFTESNIRNVALTASGEQQGESPREEGSMMKADDVAERIVRAIEKRKPRLVMSSEGRLLVVLNKMFPKWADKLVFNHFAKEANSPL